VTAERIGPPGRGERASVEADSHLRSVFLQHRLIASLPRLPGVARPVAKLVVEQVVERLLALPGGMEPLMLLERDPARLADGIAVAVLTVLLARAAGWPVEQLADLGVAALLADLGSLLDDEAPERAAFRWLLERGSEDLWLRCALVARHAGPVDGAGASARSADGGSAVLVRVARSALAAARDGGAPATWLPELRESLGDEVPAALLELLPTALGADC
jgi:hypothetical protein